MQVLARCEEMTRPPRGPAHGQGDGARPTVGGNQSGSAPATSATCPPPPSSDGADYAQWQPGPQVWGQAAGQFSGKTY